MRWRRLQSKAVGYLVADVKPADFPPPAQRAMADVGSGSGYWCWKLRLRFPDRTKQAADVLFFLLHSLLSCLTLPAITSLPLGEYAENFAHSHEGNEIARNGASPRRNFRLSSSLLRSHRWIWHMSALP